jgi:hypothetical protein
MNYRSQFCVMYASRLISYSTQFCVKYVSRLMRYTTEVHVNCVSRLMSYIKHFCVTYVSRLTRYSTQFCVQYVSRLMTYSTKFCVKSSCNAVQVCFVVSNITVFSCEKCVSLFACFNVSHSPLSQQRIVTNQKLMCWKILTYCNTQKIFC